MGYHPRQESSLDWKFVTTRCRNSELWFANNLPVEEATLGYAAKFSERYNIKLYALAIEGSHNHLSIKSPDRNVSKFMQDFNSCVARSVGRLTPHYPGGSLFARRYSAEHLPGKDDLEEQFFYTVLQPVQDGLVPRISDYPFYNCFHDAVHGIPRTVTVVNWTAYNAAKRYNNKVKIKDYTESYTLKYERLPGYESMSQRDYARMMNAKLEQRRMAIVKDRLERGLGFLGRERLLEIVSGTPAKNPKRSGPRDHRPRVLSICPDRRAEAKARYFDNYFAYKYASERYRKGDLSVQFPIGMYPPSLPCVLAYKDPPFARPPAET